MPLDDEFFLEEDLVTDDHLHEGWRIFHLFGESLDEEQDDGLETMFDADFTVLAD
jgi:negative regulator of sigma E activity